MEGGSNQNPWSALLEMETETEDVDADDTPSNPLLLAAPTIHPDDDEAPPLESILLHRYGYLSARENATTAVGCTGAGHRILVTFWAARPPRVSCFTVHCPALKISAFAHVPKILASDDDLVLLCVAVCPRCDPPHPIRADYLVYQAGANNKPPSLRMVPRAPASASTGGKLGLLRCRAHDMYFIAALCRRGNDDRRFDLHLYNSTTERWSTKLMHVDSPRDQLNYAYVSKVITIGGKLGSVGWVDVWRGILICDLLLDSNTLRYIPLPPPLVPKPLKGYPLFTRDIIFRKEEGHIKFFELHKDITQGWKAVAYKMNLSNKDHWKGGHAIDISELPVDHLACAQVLQECEDTKPTLKRLHLGYPALSLHGDDVVYIIAKPEPRIDVDKVWVVAVDMSNQTLKGVADFGSGRPVAYTFTYLQSSISKHLGVWSSTRNRGAAAETSKKGVAAPSGKQEVPQEGVRPRPERTSRSKKHGHRARRGLSKGSGI